jgi:inosine-uridine nucleoside N-ribohydrolase
MTSCAEFNFHNDPEAAHIVLASAQSHITLAPWETCMHLGIPYVSNINNMQPAHLTDAYYPKYTLFKSHPILLAYI